MNPPPPPPEFNEQQVHISRNGNVIGAWPASSIRPMLICGDLKPSDHFWTEGLENWNTLVPPLENSPPSFPYLGDDRPFYYLKGGLIYGPRAPSEIDVLYAANWINDTDLITYLGAEMWFQAGELLRQGGIEIANAGVAAFFQGDIATATNAAFDVGGRAVSWLGALLKDGEEPPLRKDGENESVTPGSH